MTRLLLVAAALLASTALGSAESLVPGSDHNDREAQAAADRSVVTGTVTARGETRTSFGYPVRPADRAPTASAPASNADGTLVPGSDSF